MVKIDLIAKPAAEKWGKCMIEFEPISEEGTAYVNTYWSPNPVDILPLTSNYLCAVLWIKDMESHGLRVALMF